MYCFKEEVRFTDIDIVKFLYIKVAVSSKSGNPYIIVGMKSKSGHVIKWIGASTPKSQKFLKMGLGYLGFSGDIGDLIKEKQLFRKAMLFHSVPFKIKVSLKKEIYKEKTQFLINKWGYDKK